MIKFLNHAVLVLFFLAIIGNWSLTRSQPKKGPMKVPDFQRAVASKYGFSDTVDLLKGAIEAQNLMVIKIIDAQQMLRLVGMKSKGMKQILFFHPRFMKRIISTNKTAAIEPPLKFAVM